MQELDFTLRCDGCGACFSRSVERPRTASEPVTLYCRHCGCPHRVELSDGVPRDRWAAVAAQTMKASGAPEDTVHVS